MRMIQMQLLESLVFPGEGWVLSSCLHNPTVSELPPWWNLTLHACSASPSHPCQAHFHPLLLAFPVISACPPATSASRPLRSVATSLLLLLLLQITCLLSAKDAGIFCLVFLTTWAQRVPRVFGMQEFEHSNENPGHCPLRCLLRQHCHVSACVSRKQWPGWAEGDWKGSLCK